MFLVSHKGRRIGNSLMSIYKILYKIFEHKDVNQNIYTVMYILLEAGASSNRKIRETAKVHMEHRVYYLTM